MRRTGRAGSVAQAVKQVFVNEARWANWEMGLPILKRLFILYQLAVGKHPTRDVTPREPRPAEESGIDQPEQA